TKKNEIMRFYVALAAIATLALTAESVQFIGDFNSVSGPFFPQQTFGGVVPAFQQQQDFSNHAVVQNSIAESQLPHELQNPFYKNPNIAAALAKESWFGHKEFPVHHREAEKISREEIYKIISRLH
ncbi:hypothetical protein JTB14_035936, partial [Gonioctena quinquepunctata]